MKFSNTYAYFKTTDRISDLAKPKAMPVQKGGKSGSKKPFPYCIPCASKRVSSLAQPKYIVAKAAETMPSDSFESNVSIRALNYVPTKRIKELARPKYYTVFEEKFGDWLDEINK